MVAVGYRVFLSTSSTSTILVQPIIINLHMFKPQIYVIVKNLSCEYVNVFFSQNCIKIQLVISGVLEEDRKKKKNTFLKSCFFFQYKAVSAAIAAVLQADAGAGRARHGRCVRVHVPVRLLQLPRCHIRLRGLRGD